MKGGQIKLSKDKPHDLFCTTHVIHIRLIKQKQIRRVRNLMFMGEIKKLIFWSENLKGDRLGRTKVYVRVGLDATMSGPNQVVASYLWVTP